MTTNCGAYDELERRLLNDYQHGLPESTRPFADMAEALGVSEDRVIATLRRLHARGAISRVGAVLPANRRGASTLAAIRAPEADLDRVAALVNAHPEVNHNYRREHEYNLWFVAGAADRAQLDTLLETIARETGYAVMDLPMLEDYFIDLGFEIKWA